MISAFIDNACLGSFQLVGVTPDYFGTDKVRHDAPVGAKYEVVLPAQKYERLTVKIAGSQQMETPLSGSEPVVEFSDLSVKPYVDRNGRLAFSANATSIKVVDTTSAGKTPAKG